MRLTTKSRYGTRLLLDLTINSLGRPVPLSDVARRQNISLKYLEHLSAKLKSDGIIVSKRGPSGGFMLARPPGQVSIGDIVRSLEGTTALTECSEPQEEAECAICSQAGECLSRWAWVEASKAMFDCLDQITLESLVNGEHGKKAKASRGND